MFDLYKTQIHYMFKKAAKRKEIANVKLRNKNSYLLLRTFECSQRNYNQLYTTAFLDIEQKR